jgi:hypothetical protein
MTIHLVADHNGTLAAFNQWHMALLDGAIENGNNFRLRRTDVWFRQLRSNDGRLHLEFWVGETEQSAAVQINAPSAPGTANGLSGIGQDSHLRRFLLRQGSLNKNNVSGRINENDFALRTGIETVPVTGIEKVVRRQWHIVTPIDNVTSGEIQAATAHFVERCWDARRWDPNGEYERGITNLLRRGERGGSYQVTPNLTPYEVHLIQGEVWLALSKIVEPNNIPMRKERHALGYEVDAVIGEGPGQILLEIKTSTSAADIYCGVGQLSIYPRLMNFLITFPRILLVPDNPIPAPLIKAVQDCKVRLHRYRRESVAGVIFSRGFLAELGVPNRTLKNIRTF